MSEVQHFIARNQQEPEFQLIERRRLLDFLAHVLERRLILISAPAGYGKTVLVSQLTGQHHDQVVWLDITKWDRDSVILFGNLLQAMGVEYEKPRLPTPDSLAKIAIRHMTNLSDQPILCVFDNLHHVAAATDVERFLEILIENAPPHVHFVFVSRTRLEMRLATLNARGQILELSADDLLFDDQEVTDLALLRGCPENITVATQNGGWAAGIDLALRLDDTRVSREGISQAHRASHGKLFSLLASELTQTLPPALLNFLSSSSTLELVQPDACEDALGLTNAHERLQQVVDMNLFCSISREGVVYHDLFRNYLQNTLRQRSPSRFRDLHRSAADWYHLNGRLREAVEHYSLAGKTTRAKDIAEQCAPLFYVEGRYQNLLNWCRELPQSGPQLNRYCAIIYTQQLRFDEADNCLTKAAEMFADSDDAHGMALVRTQEAQIHLEKGNYVEAARITEYLVNDPSTPEDVVGQASYTLGWSYRNMGSLSSAVRYLEQATQTFETHEHPFALSQIYMNLHDVHSQLGNLEKAGSYLERAVALTKQLGNDHYYALALNNLANYAYERGDLHLARRTSREALEIARSADSTRAQGYLMLNLGNIERDAGNYDLAATHYEDAHSFGSEEIRLRCFILINQTILLFWQSQFDQALEFAEEAVAIAEAHKGVIAHTAAGLCWAIRAARSKQAPPEALDDMLRRVHILSEASDNIDTAHLLVLAAFVALWSDEERALELFDEAITPSPQLALCQRLYAQVAHLPRLYSLAQRHKSRYASVLPRIETVSQLTQRTTVVESRTPIEIKVYSFGRILILIDGKPVSSHDWRSLKARDLFLYLMFHGDSTKEAIYEAFWGDTVIKSLRDSFHTAIKRARRAIGSEGIEYQARSGTYRLNPNMTLWCDAQEMEQVVTRAQRLPPSDPQSGFLWGKAHDLYQGGCLPNIAMSWADELRDKYEALYFSVLLGCGKSSFARGDFEGSLEFYRTAISIEPYHEFAHRQILNCYAQSNRRQSLIEHYEHLKEVLEAELGTTPEEETRRLFYRLVADSN